MGVLEHHRHRPAARLGLELTKIASNNFSRFRGGLRLRSAAELGNDNSSLNSVI